MEWWPAADGTSWEWAWQPYPGVWLFVGGIAIVYLLVLRRLGPRYAPPGEPFATESQRLTFALGLIALLVAAGWPIGLLGAGYSLLFHSIQHLAIAVVAAPLLLMGLPDWVGTPLSRPRWLRTLLRWAIHPVVAVAVFNGVFVATHLPPVVNAMQPTQFGSFVTTAAWLVSGLMVWWPLVGPAPVRRLPHLLVAPYLALQFVLPKLPAGIFVFSDEAQFDLYIDAPRVWAGLSPLVDQQVAGAVIWIVGGLLIVLALVWMLHRWQREERMREVVRDLGLPASPKALTLIFERPGAWEALQRLTAIVRRALSDTPVRADLAFAFPQVDAPGLDDEPWDAVFLEVRVDLGPLEQLELWERIEREFTGYLAELPRSRERAVRSALGFRVVSFEPVAT